MHILDTFTFLAADDTGGLSATFLWPFPLVVVEVVLVLTLVPALVLALVLALALALALVLGFVLLSAMGLAVIVVLAWVFVSVLVRAFVLVGLWLKLALVLVLVHVSSVVLVPATAVEVAWRVEVAATVATDAVRVANLVASTGDCVILRAVLV